MAAMSETDTAYVEAMATHQKAILNTAATYLNADPTERRANLSAQARSRISTASNCCCNGAGCCCCANSCCWDGPCGTCASGCGCGQEPAPTEKATF